MKTSIVTISLAALCWSAMATAQTPDKPASEDSTKPAPTAPKKPAEGTTAADKPAEGTAPKDKKADKAPADAPKTAPATASAPKKEAANDNLMAELQSAAAGDQKDIKKQRGSAGAAEDTSLFGQLANKLQLGKETVGNETNPALSLILDTAGAYFTRQSHERLQMGGHAPHTNGPTVQVAALAISAPIDPFFRIFFAADMYHGHIGEVFFTTTALPFNLKVRGGKYKANVGRHNMRHVHQWDFIDQPIANQFLFNPDGGFSLPGVEVSWLTPLPWYTELIGSAQAGGAGSFKTKEENFGNIEVKDLVYPVRLVQFFDVGDDWGMQLGLNTVQGTSSFHPELGNRSEAYGGDFFLKWRPIGPGHTGFVYAKLTAEGWYRKMQVPGDMWKDAGGYTDLLFGLGKEWNAGVRGEVWKRLAGKDLAATPDRARYGMNVVRGNAQVSYMPSHFSRVRAQYSLEKAELYPTNQIFLLQVEVAAGSHGAHQY